MLSASKKIWNFSSEEQVCIKKSISANFFGSIFNALQFATIYYTIFGIVDKNISYKIVGISSLLSLISIAGVIVSRNFSMLKRTHAGYSIAGHKRIELGEEIKKVPMGFFLSLSLGNLTTIATTSLDSIETWVPTLYIMVFSGMLNAIVFILSLFSFSYKVGIVTIVGSIVFLITIANMQKRSSENTDKIHEIQVSLTKGVLSTLRGMQIIKSYNPRGSNSKRLDKSFDGASKHSFDLEKTIMPYSLLAKVIIAIIVCLMLFISINLYFVEDSQIVNTVMILVASFVIFDGLITLGSAVAILRMVENTIGSYSYVSDMKDMEEGSITEPIKNHDIMFKNVSSSYDDKQILKSVSAEIKENTMAAIVGPSGSGKTTFCNLITRFWDVNSGEVLVGGKNIKDYKIENLMNSISMTFQDVCLFEDTIENNIEFGKQNASHEKVVQAVKKTRCYEFIEALPDGYNTIIGEGRASLPGREKQRVSIARAMLKDANIIIFGETTANIDPENKDKLKEAVKSLTKNETVIMITHRLKTIRNANQILILRNGEVVERGSHEGLTRNNGLYSGLISARTEAESWKLDD